MPSALQLRYIGICTHLQPVNRIGAISRGSGWRRTPTCRADAESGSPGGIRTPDRRAPIRQAIARTLITDFGIWTAPSHLDSSLRLAAHEDDKFRAVAGLRAQRLVRDD